MAGKPVPPAAYLPTIKTVDAGVWYRVHDFNAKTGKYAADAFNDSGMGNARFSPLRRADGTVIPTIYAAAHKRTAIAEIPLHEAPMLSTGWSFEWSKVFGLTRHTQRHSRMGLRLIRGLQEDSARAITHARRQAVFESAEDLSRRAGLNQQQMTALASGDALMSRKRGLTALWRGGGAMAKIG